MCASLKTLLFTQLIALKDKRICQYSTVEALITSLGFSGPPLYTVAFWRSKTTCFPQFADESHHTHISAGALLYYE